MHASRGIRKTHRKSKTGCKTCRQRRVRCDEDKPTCFNCRRRGVTCLWDENVSMPQPPQQSSDTSPGASSSTSALSPTGVAVTVAESGGPSTQVARTNGLGMSDMVGIELMHYYMAHTSLSLMTRPHDNSLHCLHIVGPRAALRFAPLMTTLFALTAMHIHIAERDFKGTPSERDYLGLADNFIDATLQDFPTDYDHNFYDPQEREPAFLAFSFLGLISFAHPNFQLGSYCPGPIVDRAFIYPDHPLSWLAATRCFQGRMMEHWDPYSDKERPVFPTGPIQLEVRVQDLSYDNLLPFPDLLKLIHTTGAPDQEELAEQYGLYDEAVRQLRLLWSISFQPYTEQLRLVMWPIAMSKGFFELIMAKRPRALVIFAHYCALLGQFQDRWVVQNRGKKDTKAIMDILGQDSEWALWMQLPLNQLNAADGLDRAIPRQERLLMAL
ncbi:hypothetical protein DL96DRAFT_1586413 [Flagelloscypha sp. PMI_526]|nr:hypothetical protein DL96DRAFT_1586413 [Flagelloscypha sp. PMI_526]